MIKRISFILLLLAGVYVQAEVKEFTREYTYNASETDSKVSARKAAMLQLQSIVIQEVGVQVQSSFTNQETLDGDDFNRKVQANHETFAQALTKTKILKETWDGEKFYLKAQITVDTDNLIEKIKTVYVQVGQGGAGAKPEDVCKARYQQAITLLEEVRSGDTIKKIIELSQSHEFDRRCNSWQFTILKDFTYANTDSDEYRAHLFKTISDMESDAMAGELMVETVRYALRIKPLTDREFDVIRDAIYRGKPFATRGLISALLEHTQRNNPDASEKEKAIDLARQTVRELEEKLMTLTLLGKQMQLSSEEPLSETDVAFTIVQQGMNRQPKVAKDYFMQYRLAFTQQQLNNLGNLIFNRFKKHPTEEMYDLLVNYLSQVDINKRVGSSGFQLLAHLKKNREDDPRYTQHLNHFMKWFKKEASAIIKYARASEHDKKLWLIEYDLPSDEVCSVKECAQQLFADKRRDAENAADFLLAYGKRAKPATDKVLKKLRRLKALNRVSNDTRLIPKLIRILDNVGANTDETYELLVWAIGDSSKKINQQASASLEKAGPKAFPVLVRLFPSQKSTPQRRMIDVMGTYQSHKQEALAFISGVNPSTAKMRFAIEDATEALSK